MSGPSDRPRGESRDRRGAPGRGRRPAGASGPIRRDTGRPAAPGERSSRSGAAPRQARTPGARTGSGRPGSSARPAGPNSTAHPEVALTTRTDTSRSVLGPRGYSPRRIGLLAVITIVLLVTVSFPLRNHYQIVGEQKQVAQDHAALERQIADLREQQDKLADPAYVEQQARIRLGAVKPGETPYRISLEDPAVRAEQERKAAERAAQSWQTRLWHSVSQPPEPGAAPPGR